MGIMRSPTDLPRERQDGTLVAVVVVCLERPSDGIVRQVAGRDNMRQGSTVECGRLAALGEMHLDEVAVLRPGTGGTGAVP